MSGTDFSQALKLTKQILSSISISFCLLLIIIYFISCLQIKCSIFAKKEIETLDKRGSFLDKTSIHSSKNKNKTKKIGLGSHYIFFLILSNLLSGVVEIISIIFEEITDNDPHGKVCQLIGFAHNFFDLSSVCWTSMLALLFYNSTKVTSQMFFKDKKYLIIGIAYTLISCIIFCVIPLSTECFGMAKTYCTFYQPIEQNNDDYIKEMIKVCIFKYIFVFFSFINTIYNIFCFHRTTRFYSTKLSLLKKQNLKEYVLVLIFVRVFQLFSITLIVSRLIKFSCMVILDIVGETMNNFIKTMIFLNAVIFDLNGTFNSIASIFFFRGVFWCCISTESDVRNVENNEEDLEEKKEGVEYSDKDSINGK